MIKPRHNAVERDPDRLVLHILHVHHEDVIKADLGEERIRVRRKLLHRHNLFDLERLGPLEEVVVDIELVKDTAENLLVRLVEEVDFYLLLAVMVDNFTRLRLLLDRLPHIFSLGEERIGLG